MQKFLRETEVLETTQLSRTTIWRLEKEGKFPKRHKIGLRAVAWLQTDIEQWIEDISNPKKGNENQNNAVNDNE